MKTYSLVAIVLLLPMGVALAETSAEQQACENDAFRLCSNAIPDRHSVFVCLKNNKNELSDSCRQVMSRYSQDGHTQSSAHRKRQD